MTTTTLITIAPSSEVNAEPLDDNFKYLNGRINDVTSTATTNTTSINSLNSTVNDLVYIPAETLSTTPTGDGHEATLDDGKLYRLSFTTENSITLKLPASNTLLSNVYHQIVVLADIPEGKTLVLSNDLANLKYFNGIAPDFSEAGKYTIIYEYDGSNWVVGAVIKKAAS